MAGDKQLGAYGEVHPEVYHHFKGGRYRLLHVAIDADSLDNLAVYLSLDNGHVWVRPWKEWSEPVMWPDGEQRPRFTPERFAP